MNDLPFDIEQLSSQLIRALRGKRSQTTFGRRVECKSNVVYSWESGRRFPNATRFFRIAQLSGVDLQEAIARFLRTQPAWLEGPLPDQRDGLVALLGELKGRRSLVEIARAAGKSRFRVARWCAGETEPRLPDLLRFVHATTYRLLDFCAALVPPARLPLIADAWRQLEATRQTAYTTPWCHAVLRLLETTRFAGKKVTARALATQLGIDEALVATSLELLQSSGQVQLTQRGYVVNEANNVDLAEDRQAVQRLKAWAATIGVERIERGAEGLYSYNLFCVSNKDYAKLQQLQRDYYRQLRAIVAESTPSERVVMTNLQLFALDE